MTELTRAIDTLKDYCKRYGQNYFAHDIKIILTEIGQLKEENKRLSAEFTNELTQSPLEIIRAKCEKYWNEPYALCPEEIQEDLGFIHQLAWSAERQVKNLQEKIKKRDREILGMLDSVSETLGIQKSEDLHCPFLRALAILIGWRKNV